MPWSSLDLASHCLADSVRTEQFVRAMRASIKPGMVVLDAGSGSGVLALNALKLGAARVFAVEKDPFVCGILRSLALEKAFPLSVIEGDLLDVELPHVHVFVAELVDVWLLEEDLFRVSAGLRSRGVIDSSTILIPQSYSFNLELGCCDWLYPDYEMRWPFYEWPYYRSGGWVIPTFSPMRRYQELRKIMLVESTNNNLSFRVDLADNGEDLTKINAIRLSGNVHLTESQSIGTCEAMNAPIVLPLVVNSSFRWESGFEISAQLSEGIKSLRVSCGGVSLLPWQTGGQ